MLAQVPFIIVTDVFKDNPKYYMRTAGNMMFWFFFCITGQPLAGIIYFYMWQRRYGSLSTA
jgi:diacylglycerol O-acyltransferase-1